ncbi:hypothetical protein [Aeromonas sp. sif0611]|uniref:hypothetical protein n=1 Tax=Aeromonas sp. sif0611 TaxID=2854787 RepID=UPI001C482B15|nr:hypothetical protein [Aeromonas sp. sif0611]MBV7468977.1 hypothetical protein [Aeromonas sp. sif0611]
MASNLDRYKEDFERLESDAVRLQQSFSLLCFGKEEYEAAALKAFGGDKVVVKAHMDAIPDFTRAYQPWYSECLVLIKQLLPDRLNDFVRLYEKPKGRKDIDFENYRIEDALQGLRTTRNGQVIAEQKSATTHLTQQIAILNSIKRRFESSLYDIRQLVQADLLDSELDVARELLKHKFTRAAGALAGVVLEKHLYEVCVAHNIRITKTHPTIADLNEALKNASAIETTQWRFHQHLGDIRNLCSHNKAVEPTVEQVHDLIDGVAKVTKTVF